MDNSILWFLLAALAPLLWAIVNIMDEYLISRYYSEESTSSSLVGSLVLFSSLFGIVVCVLIAIFNPNVFSISANNILLLLLSGLLTVGWIIAYLMAIEKAGASSVVPWFQITPILGFLAGFFILHEVPQTIQIIGSLIIISGTIVLSFDWKGGKRAFLGKPVWLMIISATLVVISGSLFKNVAIDNDFWLSTFWEYAGIGLSGVLIYLFHKRYREDFLSKLRKNGKGILGFNILNEGLSSGGNVINNLALLLAPVALVFSINAIQPIYVLVLSVLVTKLWPKIGREDLEKSSIVPKVIAIVLVVVGSVLITLNSTN